MKRKIFLFATAMIIALEPVHKARSSRNART